MRAHCDQPKGGGKGGSSAGPPNVGYILVADTVAEDNRDRVTACVVHPLGPDPWTESDPWQPGRSSTGAASSSTRSPPRGSSQRVESLPGRREGPSPMR